MSHKKRRIANICFLILSILATALSLAGYLGGFNLYLEFASGYKLQFLLLALCSLFYFGLTHHKIGLIVSLFCILLNLSEIFPWYFERPTIANVESYKPLIKKPEPCQLIIIRLLDERFRQHKTDNADL